MTTPHNWYLLGSVEPGGSPQRLLLDHFPFRVGRQNHLSLVLKRDGVSRLHAEINFSGDGLWVMDLDSTNGTFVNREAATERTALKPGDVVQFADVAFTVSADPIGQSADIMNERPPDSMAELLDKAQINILFQPMIDRKAHTLFAYEVLARGAREDLPTSPVALFEQAGSPEKQRRLSQVMRRAGVAAASQSGQALPFFLNIHPQEIQQPDLLLADIADLRSQYPWLQLVLEIHEAAVSDREQLAAVATELRRLKVQLAFDDFGSGQARLTALAQVPPDFVKLGGPLMRDIDNSPPAHQQTVRMLVSYAQGVDIRVVAEGISTDGEARFCDDLKIDLLQGYRFGEPEALTARG